MKTFQERFGGQGRRVRWLPIAALTVGAFAFVSAAAAVVAADTAALPPLALDDPTFGTSGLPLRDVRLVAEPLWTDYALTDALFWQRDNQAKNVPLVISADTGDPLISAGDPQFAVAPGVRSFFGRRDPNLYGWEIGYFGVYGMTASRFTSVTPPDFLQYPGAIGTLLTDEGESATVQYNSLVNSAEANVFRTTNEYRDFSESWLTVDWLAGFRYVGVEEQAAIVVNCCVEDDDALTPVPYRVRSRNNMFGGQIGGRARWTWTRWAIEGWAKAGLLGNAEKQMQDALVDYLGPPALRDARASHGTSVGYIGDINISVIYRLTEVWGIRAGYNTVWIGGLALAPNQFDFTNTTASGTRLVSGDAMFLNGANLGLEARW